MILRSVRMHVNPRCGAVMTVRETLAAVAIPFV